MAKKRKPEVDVQAIVASLEAGGPSLWRVFWDAAIETSPDALREFGEASARRAIEEMSVADAERRIDRDYREDVEGIAKEIANDVRNGRIVDAEGLQDRLHEDVDGAQRVIYTHQAKLGMLATSNDEAYFDSFGPEGAITRDGINWSVLMYAALEQDVIEELERLGVDVNDPQPTEEEDDD